ncbi:hypothetical protein [Ligilactobacillus salivarius]|uniref:hypothetical protein n=1 Tax=Ligilactobacillus salivarius TaxID=1624 RepID=UPI0009D93F33|nr:hypothetical protein [Ligilactobacillus salivarius]OQR18769.1 hypothetical protein B6U39_09170 [Ligilactobacillus salivarius]
MQEVIAKDVVKSTVGTTPRQAMALTKQVQMLSQNESVITISFAGIVYFNYLFYIKLCYMI